MGLLGWLFVHMYSSRTFSFLVFVFLVLWMCHFWCHLFHCGRCQVNQRCFLGLRIALAGTLGGLLPELGRFHTLGLVAIFRRYLFRWHHKQCRRIQCSFRVSSWRFVAWYLSPSGLLRRSSSCVLVKCGLPCLWSYTSLGYDS